MIRRALVLLVALAASAYAAEPVMPPLFDPGPRASSSTPDVMVWGMPSTTQPASVSIRVGPDRFILLPPTYVAAIVAAQTPEYLRAQADLARDLRDLPRSPGTPAPPPAPRTPTPPAPKSRSTPVAPS